MTDIQMPKLGETVTEGTITKWLKRVGESVKKGDPLFEVSTDKVDTEVTAMMDGVLAAQLVIEGATVEMGVVVAIIDDGLEPVQDPIVPFETPIEPKIKTAIDYKLRHTETKLSPVVRRMLAKYNLDASTIIGSGFEGRITKIDVESAAKTLPGRFRDDRVGPVIRNLIRENQLNIADISPTGPNGRISRKDIERAIASRNSPLVVASESTGSYTVPFSRIRKLTADHMVRSKATSAHTLMVREVDFEFVDGARKSKGQEFKDHHGYGLSYLCFIACAAAQALGEFPYLNASVEDNALIVHREINFGIAVDLADEGLIVPVIRQANQLGLAEMAMKIRSLAERARSKELGIDDVTGGTFSITNPGPFGTFITGAVINQPQVAILSTDGIKRKPVVLTLEDGTEAIAIHSVGMLALTFDHRAVDGAYAARYLARVDDILNARIWLDEL